VILAVLRRTSTYRRRVRPALLTDLTRGARRGETQAFRLPALSSALVVVAVAPLFYTLFGCVAHGDLAGGVPAACSVLIIGTLAALVYRDARASLHTATHCPLTGLANRRLFAFAAAQAEARVTRGQSVAVLIVDVDDFKSVNDTFGHQAGDELLRRVAARLVAAIRANDLAARYGGDEFAVLLDGVDNVGGRRVADFLAGSAVELSLIDGRVVRVTMSVGVAALQPGETVTDALRRADTELLETKRKRPHRRAVGMPTPTKS